MDDITFNFDTFYDWYDINLKNASIFLNGVNIEYYKFEPNGSRSRMINAFKEFKYMNDKYGEKLNELNDSPKYERFKKIYVNRITNSQWIIFAFPRRDKLNGRIWGDHYSFVRNNRNPYEIAFHRTDIIPDERNDNRGKNNHTDCYIKDNTLIKYEDGNYNIESITCEGYQSLTKLQNVFPKETEQNIIRDIITYPWNKNINQKFIQYAGGSISKKKHIKTVKNNKEYIEVIAIKDDDKWWYTITWNTDINKTHKFCVSSDTVPGNNNSQKIKHIISSINNKT